MALNVAAGIPTDWDYQLGQDSTIFFGGNPPNVVIDAAGVQWAMGEIDGWDSADLRRATFDNMFNHGATLGKAFMSARVLAATGMMIAPDIPTLEDAKERLRLALPINDDVPLVANETVPKYMTVRRSGRVIIKNLGQFPQPAASFSLGMIARDPRKYALLGQTASLTSPLSGAGAAFPWSFPVRFTTSSGVARTTLSNGGTAPAPVKISLVGPLSSPLITDSVSGYRLRLNMDLLDGQQIDIDTQAGSVLMNGESYYAALESAVLEPFTIAPRSAASVALIAIGSGHALLQTWDCWE